MFDINGNGVVDLVRGINWGDIVYWLDPFYQGMSSFKTFSISDSAGQTVDVRAVTDGAIVDFGDLNGDGSLDMVFGGHNSGNNLYVVYGEK